MEFCWLVRRDLLRRRAPLVEDVVQCDPNGYSVADMRDEIWARDAERDGGIVDVVDEVVHGGRGEVHEAVDLGLGCGAAVLREGGVGAAEYDAEVFVEMREEFVLV